jgi:hypothetical protein
MTVSTTPNNRNAIASITLLSFGDFLQEERGETLGY